MADRPKKFTFASTARGVDIEDLAPRFFHDVFDMNYDDIWMSDESVLGDFDPEASSDELYARVEIVYGIDVRDVKPSYVVDVLEALRARGAWACGSSCPRDG